MILMLCPAQLLIRMYVDLNVTWPFLERIHTDISAWRPVVQVVCLHIEGCPLKTSLEDLQLSGNQATMAWVSCSVRC